jgi:diacylglycerol kinase family enzyme
VNVATIGLSTAIAESLTTPMKRRLGRMVYVVAVMRALREARPFRALLETENGTTEFESLQVVIGNGRYHAGPFPVSPEASIVEGKLSVYALATATKTALLRLVLALPSGRQGSLAEVHAESTKGGRLVTRPILKVTTDGEQATRTPLVFASVPAAISVRVGDAFEEITAQA